MELIVLSSLEKVFSDEKPSAEAFSGFSMLKNEKRQCRDRGIAEP